MTMGTELRGINIAIATAMTEDGEALDLDGMRRHVDWVIENGVHGIVAAGSTGEFQALTDDERRSVVETIIEHTAGRVPVIVHCAGQSTTETIAWAKHAYDHGADALMCVPPWYAPPTEDECFEHYRALSDAVPLDIILYNIPGHSGFYFTPEFIQRLAELERCRYVKDSSGDFRGLQAAIMLAGDRITVFNGIDDLAFQAFATGTPGTVWGAVNVMPRESVRLFELVYEQKDLAAGWELWKRMWPICRFLEAHSYAAAVKTGMNILGRSLGAPRRPSLLLNAEEEAELRTLLDRLAPVGVA
jgi:4-hydroxy-tetrahydrodipicolinate synthase